MSTLHHEHKTRIFSFVLLIIVICCLPAYNTHIENLGSNAIGQTTHKQNVPNENKNLVYKNPLQVTMSMWNSVQNSTHNNGYFKNTTSDIPFTINDFYVNGYHNASAQQLMNWANNFRNHDQSIMIHVTDNTTYKNGNTAVVKYRIVGHINHGNSDNEGYSDNNPYHHIDIPFRTTLQLDSHGGYHIISNQRLPETKRNISLHNQDIKQYQLQKYVNKQLDERYNN